MAQERPRTWMEDRTICWKCGAAYTDDVVICVDCGVDLRTGEELKTNEPEEVPLTRRERALMFVAELAPGLFRPVLLVAAILTMIAGLVAMAFAFGILGFAVLSTVFIGAGGLIIYAHGLSWIIGGEFGFLSMVLAEFRGRKWAFFFALLVAPLVIGLLLLKCAAG